MSISNQLCNNWNRCFWKIFLCRIWIKHDLKCRGLLFEISAENYELRIAHMDKSVAALYKAGGFRCPQLNSFNWFKIVIWLMSWIMTHDEQKPKKAWWDWKYSLYGILLVGLFTGYFQANVGTSQTVLFQERMSVARLWDAIDGLTCTFW